MDPFTLGIVATGAFGGTLAIVGALQGAGFKINEGAITLVMECVKYGGILYLMQKLTIFL